MDIRQDTLNRVNAWLDRLEEQTKRLCESFQPEELEPAQAAHLAEKHIMAIARLLELRHQFTNEEDNGEERLLRIIFAESGKQLLQEGDRL